MTATTLAPLWRLVDDRAPGAPFIQEMSSTEQLVRRLAEVRAQAPGRVAVVVDRAIALIRCRRADDAAALLAAVGLQLRGLR